MKLKIRDVAFESNPAEGTAKIITGHDDSQKITKYGNAVEAWNVYTALALRPFEQKLRAELEENGFNRWTGIKGDTPTETELKLMDDNQEIRRAAYYDI